MLGGVLCQVTGRPSTQAMDLKKLCRAARIRQVVYTHNGANFDDALPFGHPKVADSAQWAGRPVLLIVRDPRDVLVSAYHHAKYRDSFYNGTMSDFVRSPETGIEKVLTALNRWHDQRSEASQFVVISYEAMHRHPMNVLRTTTDWLAVNAADDHFREAIEFASFDNMKQYERSNLFGDKRLMIKGTLEEGAKVRAGKIGGYINYLSPEELAYIDERTRALGDPFEAFYADTPIQQVL